MSTPVILNGTRSICSTCSREIVFINGFWQHNPRLGFDDKYEPHDIVPVAPKPPKGGSGTCPPVKQCSHRYVLLRSARWTEDSGYNTHFQRLDVFFCESCLEQKEISRDEYSRGTPAWYRE